MEVGAHSWLSGRAIAVSISDVEDLASHGLSDDHVLDAFSEIARSLLSVGAGVWYGGDLRKGGYTRVLFELVAKYAPKSEGGVDRVVNVLPFPVHATWSRSEVLAIETEFSEIGRLIYLSAEGQPLSVALRMSLEPVSDAGSLDWARSLTNMRTYVTEQTDARIVLGGRRAGFRGIMPGVLQEATMGERARKPLYIVGGFGGIAADIAQNAAERRPFYYRASSGSVEAFSGINGLEFGEAVRLSKSPHIDEVAMLIMRGLARMFAPAYAAETEEWNVSTEMDEFDSEE